MQSRPRIVVAFAAVGLCLCLTGCDLDLKATLHSDDTFDVDATYWDEGNDVAVGCTGATYGRLAQQELTDAGNPLRRGCHVTGTAIPTKEVAGLANVLLVHTADRFTLGVPWAMVAQPVETSASGGARVSLGRFQMSVTFPGEVIEHDSAASLTGTTVTWVAPTEAGMMAVALDRPGPRPELFWVGGGITAGVMLGAAGVVLIGRRRRGRAPDAVPTTTSAAETDPAAGVAVDPVNAESADAWQAAALSPPPPHPQTAAPPREDPSVWAPDSDR
jgi:hypothetical protein